MAMYGEIWRDMARYAALIVAAAAASSASSNHVGVAATQAAVVRRETPSPRSPALGMCDTSTQRTSTAQILTDPVRAERDFTSKKQEALQASCCPGCVRCGSTAAQSLKHIRARTRLPETRQQESRAIPSVATSGRMVSTSDMPNAESALKPGWIFLADGPAGTLGRCWKPLVRPRSAGGALATWPAARPAQRHQPPWQRANGHVHWKNMCCARCERVRESVCRNAST